MRLCADGGVHRLKGNAMKLLRAIGLVSLLLLAPSALAQVNVDRAIRNYQALKQGAKGPEDLTPAERAEVEEVDRLLRQRRADRANSAEQCRKDEARWSGGEPSELERRLIDLRCSQR